MTKNTNGPGRSHREGLTLIELFETFPDDHTAEKWFEANIWPDGICCPRCGNRNITHTNHKTMPYYCAGLGTCHKRFSVKTGTVMEASNIPYQKWAIATYQFATNVKGISSMKLHRDLGITQKSAWFMVHRLREAWRTLAGPDNMAGPVEVDETYVGGLEKNKHADRKGKHSKTVVAGIRDRTTGRVAASPVPEATQARLEHFIGKHIASPDTMVYSDSNPAYNRYRNHESVNHSVGEYVRGKVYTNGIESFWALLQRGYTGIFHWFSSKHMHRYVSEFAGRLNIRDYDTVQMMAMQAKGMAGRRLTYKALIA